MSVALVNFLSAFSLAEPSVAIAEKPIEISSDSTPQNFAEALAAIFLQVKPGVLPPPQPPKQFDPTATPTTPSLHPTFETRLDRVVERMREEFGHKVQVVEGFRSQTRQNALFEQGRTQPGNIVTWTKSSKHTLGLAADVTIDGTYDNEIGYQRLAQLAEQEGLRTLGAKDPGHVELASSNITSIIQSAQQSAALKPARSSASAAEVAQVAEVAKVAEVADVAKVVMPVAPAYHSAPSNSHPPAPPPIAAPTAPANTEATARTERVIEARESAATRPMSQITLKIDNDAGGTDHVRVNVRGTAVDTTITLDDPNRADRLSQRVGELHTSLERRGLEPEVVRIHTTREYDRHTPNHRDSQRHQPNDGTRHRHRRDKENPQQ